jgi:hypothetical protein
MDALGASTVVLTSVVKFLFAGLVSYGMGYGFWQTVLLTATGACLGAVVFYRAGRSISEFLRKRFVRHRQLRIASGLPPRRIFTRSNRLLVRMKRAYGLASIAILPPIISVPVTALLAAKYFRHDARTLPLLLAALVAWSVVLSTAWGFIR